MAHPPERTVIDVFLLDADAVTRAVAMPVALLSDVERERARRYRFARDRDEFTVGRLGLRMLLASHLNVEPAAVELVTGPNGAPALPDMPDPPLKFNVSHSRGIVAIAIWTAGAVGIDVEAVERLDDDSALVATILAPAERDAFVTTPPADRSRFLLHHWTAKEAYVKAIGAGLQAAPNSLHIGPLTGPRVNVDIQGVTWAFHRLAVGRRHVATLACDDLDATLRVRCWNETLVASLTRWTIPALAILEEW